MREFNYKHFSYIREKKNENKNQFKMLCVWFPLQCLSRVNQKVIKYEKCPTNI